VVVRSMVETLGVAPEKLVEALDSGKRLDEAG
jgi:hypothetical protein